MNRDRQGLVIFNYYVMTASSPVQKPAVFLKKLYERKGKEKGTQPFTSVDVVALLIKVIQ